LVNAKERLQEVGFEIKERFIEPYVTLEIDVHASRLKQVICMLKKNDDIISYYYDIEKEYTLSWDSLD
jgi:hypothetical protein